MSIPDPGTPIIIDIGSAYVKVGFAGEPEPRHIFPCITGTEKYQAVMADVNTRSIYVGDDAMRMRGVLKVSHPIQKGAIMDWNAYYEILNYIFYSLLRIENLSEYPVLYAEHTFVSNETKEYIARVLFETHNVKSLMMVPSSILSMFSVGMTTGLIVESGDGITWVVPIVNGQIYTQAVQRLTLAGSDVNQNLKALLMREGIQLSSSAVDEILREIKEKNCYFVLDPRNPPEAKENFSYPMPDGNALEIPHRVLYEAPEVMFQPSMLGYNFMNLSQAIIYSLQLVPNEYWGELLTHIILSGGNVSYSGFEERLKAELAEILPQLGPIPKPPETTPEIDKPKKLQSFGEVKREKDTCPQCGELVDLSDGKEFCPKCGASMKLPEISIDLDLGKQKKKKKKEGKCPHCGKEVKDTESVFCPYCGKNIEEFEAPEPETIIETSPAANEFEGFYDESKEIIKFYIPDDPLTAIYNGASILASLPSFQELFITQTEFQTNKEKLYQDFSQFLQQ